MKLLREISEEIVLSEATINDVKNHFIEGIFMQSEIKNGNGRFYPKRVMAEATELYIENSVNRRKAYGELDHPKGANILLKNVSHIIESLKPDGNNWVGKARIMEETPSGKTAIGLIKGGANLGVSSRALGSINETSSKDVVESMRVITAGDIVADPSAPDAFMDALYEGREWVMNNGVIVEKIVEDELKNTVSLVERRIRRVNAFTRFLKEMKYGG